MMVPPVCRKKCRNPLSVDCLFLRSPSRVLYLSGWWPKMDFRAVFYAGCILSYMLHTDGLKNRTQIEKVFVGGRPFFATFGYCLLQIGGTSSFHPLYLLN